MDVTEIILPDSFKSIFNIQLSKNGSGKVQSTKLSEHLSQIDLDVVSRQSHGLCMGSAPSFYTQWLTKTNEMLGGKQAKTDTEYSVCFG